MLLGLGAVILLILLHAFFVTGEFALVAADRARIEQLAEKGHKGALSVQQSLRKLSFELSGAQLGITITSLLVGFLAEPLLAPFLEPALEALGFVSEGSIVPTSIALALILATAFEMVVAELIPRNVAIAKPVEVSFRVAAPMRLYNRIFKPLILFLNGSANRTLRLFGVEPKEELASARSLEELDLLIRSSRAEGTLPEENAALLARSIAFGGKTAADALIPRTRVVALDAGATLADVASAAVESGHSRFPVYEEDLDHVLGTAHVKDIYTVDPGRRATTPVTQIVQDALVVPESRPLTSLLGEMRRQRRHLAVVIDEFGGTAGVVTLEDLIEEIVGEIDDEYDPASAPPGAAVSAGGGTYILSGMAHPDEVLEACGLELPEGDYETIAGFLLSVFDRIPEQGDHTTFEGWEIKVVEMDKHRIAKVLLVAPDGGDEGHGGDQGGSASRGRGGG